MYFWFEDFFVVVGVEGEDLLGKGGKLLVGWVGWCLRWGGVVGLLVGVDEVVEGGWVLGGCWEFRVVC